MGAGDTSAGSPKSPRPAAGTPPGRGVGCSPSTHGEAAPEAQVSSSSPRAQNGPRARRPPGGAPSVSAAPARPTAPPLPPQAVPRLSAACSLPGAAGFPPGHQESTPAPKEAKCPLQRGLRPPATGVAQNLENKERLSMPPLGEVGPEHCAVPCCRRPPRGDHQSPEHARHWGPGLPSAPRWADREPPPVPESPAAPWHCPDRWP